MCLCVCTIKEALVIVFRKQNKIEKKGDVESNQSNVFFLLLFGPAWRKSELRPPQGAGSCSIRFSDDVLYTVGRPVIHSRAR